MLDYRVAKVERMSPENIVLQGKKIKYSEQNTRISLLIIKKNSIVQKNLKGLSSLGFHGLKKERKCNPNITVSKTDIITYSQIKA